MISARYLLSALLAGVITVEGFAPMPIASSSATRLYEAPPLQSWAGPVFKESNPDFANGDLSSIEMTKNLDNIDKITRMQKIYWPEFSWLSKIGDPSSRVYVTFAQDVSRIGYDEEGRIWALICPQRGIPIPLFGTGFVEVTVTGVRGWVDESTNSCYADISVEGNFWLEPAHGNPLVEAFMGILDKMLPGAPFPFSKPDAVKVDAYQVGKPWEPIWPMSNGTDPGIFQPLSKRHYDDGAYAAYHLEVEMGKRLDKGYELVDRFDEMLLALFNMASGSILEDGQRVSWNVWANAPESVDRKEWEDHADLWFNSMNIKHEYPSGGSLEDRDLTHFDGTEYDETIDIGEVKKLLKEFIADAKEIVGHEAAAELDKHPLIRFLVGHFMEKRTDHIKNRE